MAPAARLLPVLLAAAVGGGAGCGYDPEPEPVENATIGLHLDEYRILPQAARAPAGPLRLIIRNDGLLPHNIAVETIPPIGSEEEPTEIARTETVHSGDRAEVSFTIDEPGEYQLVCTIANHDDLGQIGKLVVQ